MCPYLQVSTGWVYGDHIGDSDHIVSAADPALAMLLNGPTIACPSGESHRMGCRPNRLVVFFFRLPYLDLELLRTSYMPSFYTTSIKLLMTTKPHTTNV